MITPEETKAIALSFEGTDEKPHFERTAFTVKKKIFATLSFKDKTLNLRFTIQVQMIFCPPQSDVIFPVNNAWGRQGWTTINLNKANKKLVQSAMKEAYKLRKEK
jgi:YjbR